MFYDKTLFAFTQELEDHWQEIRRELDQMEDRIDQFAPFHSISPDQTFISSDEKWKMFFLKTGNIRMDRNCREFPITMGIVDKYPEIVSAYFSVIGPNKMLTPHVGPWSGILRAHLGLHIPTDGKGCALVVEGTEYRWKEGEMMVFDDTYEHFAINLTNHNRIVLFLDVMRPLPWFWHQVNKSVVYLARFLPYFRTPIKRHAQWEKKFYGDNYGH